MGASTDIYAQINAPKLGAIHLIGIHKYISRYPRLRIVFGIGGIPFENDLILAIPVQITNRRITGRIGVGHRRSLFGGPAGGAVQIDREDLRGPNRGVSTQGLLHSPNHGLHGVLRSRDTGDIHQIGGTRYGG